MMEFLAYDTRGESHCAGVAARQRAYVFLLIKSHGSFFIIEACVAFTHTQYDN